MVVKTDLEKFKSRWRRFVGQKTRIDKPYWTSLLDNIWSSWCDKVLEENTFYFEPLRLFEQEDKLRMNLRNRFNLAIDCATMRDLIKLDNIYCQEVLIGS